MEQQIISINDFSDINLHITNCSICNNTEKIDKLIDLLDVDLSLKQIADKLEIHPQVLLEHFKKILQLSKDELLSRLSLLQIITKINEIEDTIRAVDVIKAVNALTQLNKYKRPQVKQIIERSYTNVSSKGLLEQKDLIEREKKRIEVKI